MSAHFTLKIDETGGLPIILLTGRADSDKVSILDRTLRQLLTHGRTQIVLDCSRLAYLNSAGVSLVLDYQERAAARGGAIKWVGLRPDLLDVLQLLHAGACSNIFQTSAEAIQSFPAKIATATLTADLKIRNIPLSS